MVEDAGRRVGSAADAPVTAAAVAATVVPVMNLRRESLEVLPEAFRMAP